jgi:hypothetical protein
MARSMFVAALVALLVAVASGCGSSASDDDVASLDGTTTTTDEESTASADEDEDPQEAALKWARCMREHGVDVPDPEVSEGRVRVRAGVGGRLREANAEKFEAARKACGSPFGAAGAPELSEEDRQAMQEAMLEFARCMREHGIDMPDPTFSGSGGGIMRVFRGSLDPDSPKFREAEKACQPILRKMEDELGLQGGSREVRP